jgi:hypothetical protein
MFGQRLYRPAPVARPLRVDRHSLADAGRVDALADRDDAPGHLVPQHQWGLHDEVSRPHVAVVMHVRPADPDRSDLDQHLAQRHVRNPALLHHHGVGGHQDAGPHRLRTVPVARLH